MRAACVFVSLLLAAALPAAAWQEPRAAVTSVHIARIDLVRMTVAFGLVVHNPNAFPLRITSLDYTLDAGTSRLAQARHAAAFTARPHGAAAITVNVPVAFDNMYDAVGSPQAAPRCAYAFAAIVTCTADGHAPVRVRVGQRGTLPVITAPLITLKSLRVDSITPDGANMIVTLNVTNPNTFHIVVVRLTYDLAMNDTQWARGAVPTRVALPPQRTTLVHIPVTMALATFRQLPLLLARNEPVQYRLRGYLDARTSLPELRTLAMPYDRSGIVNLRELAAPARLPAAP